VKVKNNKTNEESEIACEGLFVAIGHKPNTEIFKDQLELDKKNYLVLKDHSMTSIEGVFGAGDVHDHEYRQAVTAAGMGCAAAIEAERWLESQA
jgi:thioredoxin reductase (NADPH)